MKLKDALWIGEACGLETVGESLLNIQLHAMNIFTYGEEQREYDEIIRECKLLGVSRGDRIDKWLSQLK